MEGDVATKGITMVLFDKHEKPNLTNLTADEAWAACDEFEDYVYRTADNGSDEDFGRRIDEVCALRNEYYALFE